MSSILFVNPSQGLVYEKYTYSDYQFPLGLAYVIGSILPEHEVHVLDCNSQQLSMEKTISKIVSSEVDYVAFTCTTPLFNIVQDICKRIKTFRPEMKTIVGGPHITYLHEYLTDNPEFDFLFVGEAESSLKNFLETNDKPKIVYGTPTDVDSCDPPPRHLFYNDTLKDFRLGGSFTYAITSRGCVGRCKYCVAGAIKGVRFRSIESINHELHDIVNVLNITNISFEDDNFIVRPKRTKALCNEIGIWGINYYAMAIAKFVTEDTLKRLKDSGCTWLCYGIESGDNDILKDMGRLSTTEDVLRATDLTHKIGIKIRASYMLGWIGETEEHIRKTLALMKRVNAHENATAIVTPYPGTYLWNEYFAPYPERIRSIDFNKFCYYNKVGWNFSNLSDKALLDLQQEAFTIKHIGTNND